MIERALERVRPHTTGALIAHQTDVRALDAGEERFDIVIAAAVLHHLRTDAEWEAVFTKIYRALRHGGAFWVADLVAHTQLPVQELMDKRYAEYLDALGGEAYRDEVLRYIEAEDTPKPL